MLRRQDRILLLAMPLAVAVLGWLLVAQGPLRYVENWFGDLRIALATPREPPPPDILVLTITDETLSGFPYRSPVNRAFLAELVELLSDRGARAIGLDILFDQPTEPAADQALAQALASAKPPVFVAYADQEHLNPEQQRYLDAFTAGLGRAYVNLPYDNVDGIIRSLFPGRIAPDGRFVPGMAAALADREIPAGELALRYRGLPPDAAAGDLTSAIKHYPAHLARLLPAAWLADKLVLVGADLPLSSEDVWKTPFVTLLGTREGSLPGVMIHAHALAQIQADRWLPHLASGWVLGLYWLAALVGAGLARPQWSTRASIGLALGLLLAYWAPGFWWYHRGGALLPLAGPALALLTATGWSHALIGRQERREKEFIHGAFARYLHPDWVEQLMANPQLLGLRGERREITVLFTDVAGFTTTSECLPARTLVHVLSRYLEGMTQLIIAHGGAVNKYLGDGIMVLFGAPVAQADHAQRALRCALALDAFAERCRQGATGPDGEPVAFGQTRIGIHTGEATVGNFGSQAKLEYTAIGDVVNVASRLEGLNAYFGTRVAISAATRERIRHERAGPDKRVKWEKWAFRPMGEVMVKGKAEALAVFAPLEADTGSAELGHAYDQAYALMAAEDPDAPAAFAALHAQYPQDPLIAFHARRLEKGEQGARIRLTAK